MVIATSDWEERLGRWLEPFLACLGHKVRQRICPLYVAGLVGFEREANGSVRC